MLAVTILRCPIHNLKFQLLLAKVQQHQGVDLRGCSLDNYKRANRAEVKCFCVIILSRWPDSDYVVSCFAIASVSQNRLRYSSAEMRKVFENLSIQHSAVSTQPIRSNFATLSRCFQHGVIWGRLGSNGVETGGRGWGQLAIG